MEVSSFLGVEPVDDTHHWRMAVRPDLSTPEGFLFGGCGLGAGLVALESASERPTVCATAQFLFHARRDAIVDWEVSLGPAGRDMTHGKAVARVDGRDVVTVSASLGVAEPEVGGVWVDRPGAPAPDECRTRSLPDSFRNSILDKVEVRAVRGRHFEEVDGTPGSPESVMWIRVGGDLPLSAAALAIAGDYIPHAASQPIGQRVMARSLDNTLRIVALRPSEWVLCDMRIHALHAGYGHGSAFLWSEDGELMATANQSFRARLWTGDAEQL